MGRRGQKKKGPPQFAPIGKGGKKDAPKWGPIGQTRKRSLKRIEPF